MCNVVSRQQNIQASNLLRVPELVTSVMITVHFVVILLSKPKRKLLFGNFSSWIRKLAFPLDSETFPLASEMFPGGFGNFSGWIWIFFNWSIVLCSTE